MRRPHPFPKIWILDDDPILAASYLSDRDVNRNVKNAFKLLINAYWYTTSIRNPKIYEFIKNLDNCGLQVEELRDNLMTKTFKFYPTGELPVNPCNKTCEFKFTRQCLNHFLYVKGYFKASLNEYSARFNKDHPLYEIADWMDAFPPDLPMIELRQINYPLKSIAFRYRDVSIVTAMRNWYKRKLYDPLKEYNRRSVPDWFNLSEKTCLQHMETSVI
jgi:hypothetical protein